MEKRKIVLPLLAFVFAVAGAFASVSLEQPTQSYFKRTGAVPPDPECEECVAPIDIDDCDAIGQTMCLCADDPTEQIHVGNVTSCSPLWRD